MRKDILMKKLARLQNKKETMTSRALASTDAAEVRSINEQLEEVNAEIDEVKEELKAIEDEERTAQVNAEARSLPPVDATKVNGTVIGSFVAGADNAQTRENVDTYATMEVCADRRSYTGKPCQP